MYVYNVNRGVDIDLETWYTHMHIYINILYIITIRGETVTKDNQNVHVFKQYDKYGVTVLYH